MIKIAYISRVAIPNRVAQAEQILSMSRAFYDILNEDFFANLYKDKSKFRKYN